MAVKTRHEKDNTVDVNIASTAKALAKVNIPLVLWGEHAMVRHGIPTMLIRDDVIVPAGQLDIAAAELEANGWTVSSHPLPRYDSFWRDGWKYIADMSRRFFHPGSNLDATRQLLILPSTFVGLDTNLTESELNESPFFEGLADNVYCPSAPYLLQTILHPLIAYGTELESARFLFRSWASYFHLYLNFRGDAMDGCDSTAAEYWQEEFVERYAKTG